jgi:hypothetical protein
MILYPTLVQAAEPVDPALLAGEPASVGPPLIDVDAATAGPIEPPVEPEPPPADFRERWSAMPAAWILARRP